MLQVSLPNDYSSPFAIPETSAADGGTPAQPKRPLTRSRGTVRGSMVARLRGV
jgi:hypothetical protein